MSLTVVILTKDESPHIARAINSIAGVADRIVVVDSGSSDDTILQARDLGAEVMTHPFENQAKQFNWALKQLEADTDWVFRLDADEVVSPRLARSFATLPGLGPEIAGAEIMRRMAFLGRPIRWGGLFPVPIVRVIRYGRGRCEERWMDEHIIVDGQVVRLEGELLDDNVKPISWWIDKHNAYSSREVVEILDEEFGFLGRKQETHQLGAKTEAKRWIKMNVYARLPRGLRAFGYFFYRYVLRLGFLDGREGTMFHVLQGFWYRFLVDTKLFETKQHMRRTGTDPVSAIRDVLGVRIDR